MTFRLPQSHANRGRKYRNVKTEVDGHTFDSRKEARRYGELKLLERAGEIGCLTLQPKFPLVVNGVKVCEYRADFSYTANWAGGPYIGIVEDVKGMKTPMYRLKKKLMKALYNVEIKET